MGDLTKNFSRFEFACKCGCGLSSISPLLVDLLQQVREGVGPLSITSGCRCPSHNLHVGGRPNSAHLRGLAADLHCNDSRLRFLLLRTILPLFHRIEICPTWLHVDIDPTLPQDIAFFQ